MFHIGRCGSTVIGDMLSQRTDTHWDGEIYEPVNKLYDSEMSYWEFLKQRITLSSKENYGFEVKFYHLRQLGCDLSTFLSVLKYLDFNHIILLKRQNYLKKVISSLVARVSNRWHISSNDSAKKEIINIDPFNISIDHTKKSLLDLLEEYDNDIKLLDNSGKVDISLTYENHVRENPERAYKIICDKVGLDYYPVKVRLGKTTPFLIKEIVGNYDELNRYLTGSKFEWMLKD